MASAPAAISIKPVYALVGSDAFLQLQKLGEILRPMPDAQRIDADGERAELADVLDELRSFAMFGGRKVVVVQNADAFVTRFREPLEEYVAHPSMESTLVLRMGSLPATQRIAKAIARIGQIQECNPPRDLARWITDRGPSAHGVTVMPEAARLLADMIGDDLGRLDNELAKLAIGAEPVATIAGNRLQIRPQDVAAGVAFQREQQMAEMTNAVAAGRPADAIRKWRQMVQADSSAEFRAVTWLTIWLTNVRKALALRRGGMHPSAIPQALRIWPRDIQQPFMQTAIAMGETRTNRAIDLLAEIDRQSKSGVGAAAENVERFLLSLAEL
jgi:DNA polymerase-3 subunit delta